MTSKDAPLPRPDVVVEAIVVWACVSPGAKPVADAAVIRPLASIDVTVMITSCVALLPPTSVPSTEKVSPTT